RAESAHGLAMQVVEIADAAGPGDNPQLVKNRCDQRRWLAGKYNALYSDKVAVTDRPINNESSITAPSSAPSQSSQSVPEPSTALLLGAALAACVVATCSCLAKSCL